MNLDSEKLSKIGSSIRNSIDRSHKNLLNEYPIEQYEKHMYNRPEAASYTYIPPDLKRFCSNIIKNGSRKVLQLYHKLIILSLIDKNMLRLHVTSLPDSIKDFYIRAFEMIVNEIYLNPDDFYEYSNDKFTKDLNICALKLIPVGPGVIELSRIPRRSPLKSLKRGMFEFIEGICFILFRVGGFKPLYQIHTYLRGLADFNEREWDRAYLRIADILKVKGGVKGIFRSSWFIDPKLQEISPRLTYLRGRIEQNGGRIFYVGSTPEDVKNATLKSPTRRRFYEEEKYIPTSYMAIWPRKQLINWAEGYYTNNPGGRPRA